MNEFLGSEDDLSDEDKALLIAIAIQRLDFLEAKTQHQRYHIQYLQEPTEANKALLERFEETVIEPKATEIKKATWDGIKRSINIEGLKEVVPMLLLVLKNNVNIPLLLGAGGIQPQVVEDLMELVTKTIKEGLPPWDN